MNQFRVGDKVKIKGKPEVYTIAEVYGTCFYGFVEEEVAHFYLEKTNYENFYFGGDLESSSI